MLLQVEVSLVPYLLMMEQQVSLEVMHLSEACEIVARRFAADFEAFGYDAGECAALVHM